MSIKQQLLDIEEEPLSQSDEDWDTLIYHLNKSKLMLKEIKLERKKECK